MSVRIKRLAGNNKQETFKAINDAVNVEEGTPVFIATEDNFPDALSASGMVGIKGYPILLSTKGSLPKPTVDSLISIKPSKVYIVGGTGVVPDSVVKQLMSVTGLTASDITRLSGTNRYETSLAIAKFFNLTTTNAVLATGANFPDVLAGSSLASKLNAPIILVSKDIVTQKQYLDSSTIGNLTVLGGEGAIPSSTIAALSSKTSSTSKYEKIRLNGTDEYDDAIQISNEFAKNNSIGGTYSASLIRNADGTWSDVIKTTDITNSFTSNAAITNCIIIGAGDKATAIGSSPLSVYLNAPVLITGKGTLNKQTQAQLSKLRIKNVYIAGGTDVVSSSVEQQLKTLGYNVIRYGGNNAIETNRIMMKAIPQSLWGLHPKVVNESDWVQGARCKCSSRY